MNPSGVANLPNHSGGEASSSGAGQPGSSARPVANLKTDKDKPGRQSFSCAECRRLKLKCSREWPCTSCEKRGCAQICPNGEMRTGKGKRLILADTAELHQRISLLEVALAQAHAKTTSTAHPLLESPYLFSPRDNTSSRPYPRPNVKAEPNTAGPKDEDDVVEGAFGTLTIGEEGHAKFVGSFAGSEYLREEGVTDDEESSQSDLDVHPGDSAPNGRLPLITPPATAQGDWQSLQDVNGQGGLGLHPALFGGGDAQPSIDMLRQELPDYNLEGRALVESYWDNVNWQYQPIPRQMFQTDHVMSAYDTESPPNAHKLACVFLVMAIGAMFDLNRQPFHPRGEQLFRLGRACIGTSGIEHCSPATVQALHLMGTYILNDKRGNGAEVFWPILGTAVKVAQSLGLHRDGSHYGLSRYEIEERRQVWWELVTYDRLQALCFGRPCATSDRWSDTKVPEAADLIGDEDGFHRAKYTLITMMERVIDVQTQPNAVSFSAVMQLDSELKEFKKNLPELLMPTVAIQDLPLDRDIDPHLVIHRLGIRLQVAQMRLLLNRPLFARALKGCPDDPSRSKLGPSFIALFESAHEIVQLVKTLVIYHPSLVARWWFFWFHAFSSAVCLAAIVIRAPKCAFASPAFHGMSIVCDISAAAREGCRAKKGLPILLRLRKRAHDALSAATRLKERSNPEVTTTTEEDDLSHLAGSAKLRRIQLSTPRRAGSSPNGPNASAGHVHGVGENTPSPTSGVSIATSATLAEPGVYEGVVPGFPADQSMYPTQQLPPLATTSTWVPEDPMNHTGYPMGSPSAGFPGMVPGQGFSSPLGQSQSLPGPGFQPEFDMQLGVDMDMSIAFGIDRSMGDRGQSHQNGNGHPHGYGQMNGQDQPFIYRPGPGHEEQPNGGVVGQYAQAHGQGVFSPDTEVYGFNFEDFVNQMGGG
ncbi:hypothetical protein IAU60_006870 [Kwoniella sp. DSM 27419]